MFAFLSSTRTRVEGFHSADGSTGKSEGFADIDLGPNAQVGLVVNGHNTTSRTTATFSNVSP